jgi:serine/threonine protein kinase
LELALNHHDDPAHSEDAPSFPFSDSRFPPAPGGRIGPYKLLQIIGEGGSGVVYMADQHEPVHRRIAVKVVRPGLDTEEVLGRFEVEREALALMDHPNIAKMLDAGATETARPFFAMELVRGIPITRYCDDLKLKAEERLGLFLQVCQAVQHAHQKGIIHQGIKPSNILVANQEGTPVPKIIDLGIAKATASQFLTTSLEQFAGTPAYMSPEQAKLNGQDIDTRSDIYSLGVLLYELLTGKTPFDGKRLSEAGLDEIRRIIREEEPPRPSQKLSTLSAEEQAAAAAARQTDAPRLIRIVGGDLDWIVMKCLEKDRDRRYASANGLASDIERHFNNEPVAARPTSKAYRFQKMVRRNKLAFATGTAVGAAVLIGLAVSTYFLIQERRALDRARAAKLVATDAMQHETALKVEAQSAAKKTLALFSNLRGVDDPAALEAMESLANSYEASGLSEEAIKLRQEVLGRLRHVLGSAHAYTLAEIKALAWTLATSDSVEIRNGTNAVLLAEEGVAATQRKDAGFLDTLAAAYAETQQFDKAVAVQQEAIGLLQSDQEKKDYHSRLKLYEAKTPYRNKGN